LRITQPFSQLSKADVLRQSHGAPLEFALSCIRPRGLQHCGACNKCAERKAAFRAAEVPDPTDYVTA
jgi:7-cyano-7-deazaguanine synthase